MEVNGNRGEVKAMGTALLWRKGDKARRKRGEKWVARKDGARQDARIYNGDV